MNFLSHAHLSFNKDDIIFGNFIADSIKGKSYERFGSEVQIGVLLHREIDSYTDNHELFKNSRSLVRPYFGKFSGIVIDIYFDHFLARNWSDYDNSELSSFSRRVYMILAKRYRILPPRIKRLLPFLIGQNWLTGYANISDLSRVFRGMDRRTGYISGMENAIDVLVENYDSLYENFKLYYPQLTDHAVWVYGKMSEESLK